jgi:hypothetical protein
VPELRRGAGRQAGDDAIDRLHAVPRGHRPHVAAARRHRRRARALRAEPRQRAADPARQPRHARARQRRAALLAGRRLRRALRSRRGEDDEQTFWREYLLYHRSVGFAFLVDAEDGWSWSAPIAGAPQSFGDSVKHEGVLYRKLYDYVGKVTFVLGEFYWRLARDERTANTDYVGTGAAAAKRLNREETRGEGAREVVWSAGETLSGRHRC